MHESVDGAAVVVEVNVTEEGLGAEQLRPGGLCPIRETVPVNP